MKRQLCFWIYVSVHLGDEKNRFQILAYHHLKPSHSEIFIDILTKILLFYIESHSPHVKLVIYTVK